MGKDLWIDEVNSVNIYVDFDDCLCETAREFTRIVKKMYGKEIPYEQVHFFDLQQSFDLTREQYEEMMLYAHRPEILMSFEETPGASEVLNEWIDKDYNVSVITGRPYSAYEPSRRWLDEHGLERVKMMCLDKYGRDSFIKNSEFNLKLEDFYRMDFDFAVEDSPMAFRFFDGFKNLNVLVFDRPWNHEHALPGENYHRCPGWNAIREYVI